MEGEEWNEKWKSLEGWLARWYNLEPVPVRKRQCFVDDDYCDPERTLYVAISDVAILTPEFLDRIQQWVREEAPQWRVAIPTDETPQNQIFIYPGAIKINPTAEQDIDSFLAAMRPATDRVRQDGRRRFGLDW